MKKISAIFAIAVVVLFCASIGVRAEHEPHPEHSGDDGAERITASELKARIDSGENIVIFDVRAREARGATKVKGAITMPLNELEGRLNEIPFGALIAAYCT